MAVSKKDIRRVLEGEKRVRVWHEKMQRPAWNPLDKDGNRRQVRARFVRKDAECIPEQVNREEAIRSGGLSDNLSVRSADGKFAREARSYGDLVQGKVYVSKIDGHVYGSVQKIGRSVEEAARDEGMGPIGTLVGGKGKVLPIKKRNKPSPFKRRWEESTFILERK